MTPSEQPSQKFPNKMDTASNSNSESVIQGSTSIRSNSAPCLTNSNVKLIF